MGWCTLSPSLLWGEGRGEGEQYLLSCCEIDNKNYLIHLKVLTRTQNIIFTIYKNEINVLFIGSLVHSIHQHREPLCLTLLYWALAELAVHAANIASHGATTLWSVVDPNQEFATRLAAQYQARQQSVDEAMTDLTFTPC